MFHKLKKDKEYNDAEKLYQEMMKDRSFTENENILDLNHSFAAMLVEQKKFQDAEPIARAVWEKRKQDPGPPSGVSQESHRQLCSILCAVGKNKDAENMQRAMYQAGTTDAWTLENGDEVCQRLREQGEIRKAKELQEEVWQKRRGQNVPQNDLTVKSGLCLISLLEELVTTADNQDGSDAERRRNISLKQTYECDIEVTLRQIWDPRPQQELTTDTLNAGHKLGDVVFLQGKFTDAEAIFIRVWEGKKRQRKLGERHASTISTGCMLGKTLCRLGEQETYRRAVDILRHLWPTIMQNGDAGAISSGEDLAQAYSSTGDLPNAEHVYEWIVKRKLETNYPTREIEDAYWHLGQIQFKRRNIRNREAQRTLAWLYEKWNASSPDPCKTLECGYMLAQLLSTLPGKDDEARNLARDVFNGRRALEEKGVPYLESSYLYSSLLLKEGRDADAKSILQPIWERQAEVIEVEEQRVRLSCGHLLSEMLARKHKYSDAKTILEAVAEGQIADSAGTDGLEKTRRLLDEVNHRLKKTQEKGKRNSGRRGGFIFSKKR